ncbi:hypothetical protein D3C76_1659180 [compost metagenome]
MMRTVIRFKHENLHDMGINQLLLLHAVNEDQYRSRTEPGKFVFPKMNVIILADRFFQMHKVGFIFAG